MLYFDHFRNAKKETITSDNFRLSSNEVEKQLRQLAISTKHLTKILLTNVRCNDGSFDSLVAMRVLKMKNTSKNTREVTEEINVDH